MPVQVDVITPLPERWGLCTTCETFIAQANLDQDPNERALDSIPPEWLEDYVRLSDLIMAMAQKYGEGIVIRLFDPRSLQGLLKSIRYGVHKYPTFLVDDQEKVVGLDAELLDMTIRTVQNRVALS
jgi:hypothetical protein